MTKQNHDNRDGRFRQFWTTWRGWLMLAVFALVVVAVLAVLGVIGVIETGFGEYTPPTAETERGKTLWDWMELLLVPLVLAVGAAFFTWTTNKRAREIEGERIKEQRRIDEDRIKEQQRIELDRSRETALQTYLDRMTELIKDGLPESEPDDVRRSIARARTLTVLRQLDGVRKGLLLRFLYEADLVGGWTEGEENAEIADT